MVYEAAGTEMKTEWVGKEQSGDEACFHICTMSWIEAAWMGEIVDIVGQCRA